MNGLYVYKDFNVLIRDVFHSNVSMMDNVYLISFAGRNLAYHSFKVTLMAGIAISGLHVLFNFNVCKRNVLPSIANIEKIVLIILNAKMAHAYIQ